MEKQNIMWSKKKTFQQCKTYSFINVLSKSGPKKALEKLQKDLAIVPVDKASANVSFVCKAHYMDILIYEVTVSGNFEKVNPS